MKVINKYKAISIVLLLFNLIGAYYGGVSLIIYPDGSNLQLNIELLDNTPFNNYLFPGIILLTVNGLFCTAVLYFVLRNNPISYKLIIAQGLMLTGWIVIQMFLIRTVFFLHYVMGGTGFLLIILGWLLSRLKSK